MDDNEHKTHAKKPEVSNSKEEKKNLQKKQKDAQVAKRLTITCLSVGNLQRVFFLSAMHMSEFSTSSALSSSIVFLSGFSALFAPSTFAMPIFESSALSTSVIF